MKPSYIQLPEARSTNTYLSTIASTTAHGTVVYTLRQTAGRGQRGNSWESEDGKNITFSMLIRPSVAPSQQFFISEAAALAVARTLDKYIADGGVSVKWPNDVYWHDKKICGMLIEHSLSGGRINSSILGIGVNINQQQFLSDAPNPVSMAQVLGHEVDRGQLMEKLVARFGEYYALIVDGAYADIAALYLQHLYRRDDFYKYRDSEGEFEARVVEVEDDGHLILHDRQGCIRSYAFKEVSFVI